MKRLLLLVLVACGLALVGAAPPSSVETLLEQGNKAMQERDFTRAIELYEQAEPLAADPSLVTLYLAQATYERGIKDKSPRDLYQAEQLFGYLLDDGNPHRTAALLGLGNCRLQRAGDRDVRTARLAIDAYEECLTAAKDEALRADARYNLERAHLLLQQIQTAEDDKQPPEPETNTGNDANTSPPKPQTSTSPDKSNTGAGQKPVGAPEPVRGNDGNNPIKTDSPPMAGKGDLRPVPDQPDLPPLTAEEAREHLRQANERILRERRQHRMGLAKPPADGVPDW
jgi:tetratricopeptide (TPR) repeat protein